MIAQDFALYVIPESVLRGKYEVCMNMRSRLNDHGGSVVGWVRGLENVTEKAEPERHTLGWATPIQISNLFAAFRVDV